MAGGITTIGKIAQESGFRGSSSHRISEPINVQSLPLIDNSLPGKATIRTSVDCYVSGQYIQKGGKIIEVQQRYTVFISYSQMTQLQSMNEIRARIVEDFESKYGRSFNITAIFVPSLPTPKDEREAERESVDFYQGSSLFKEMSKYERLRYDVGTERLKADVNIRSIRKRYSYR